MKSGRIVDLRRRRAGSAARPLPMREASKRVPLRSRRRKMQLIAFFGFAVLAAAGVYGASIVSYLPQFSIERIEVQGAHELRPELVEAFVATKLWDGTPALLSESNVILFPREKIEAALTDFFPGVEEAAISRASLFANAVTVSIRERKPFARWCREIRECYAMDPSGVIYARASTTPAFETTYVFEGHLPDEAQPIAQRYLPGRLSAVLALLERLGQTNFSPQIIVVGGDQDFSITLAEGFSLRVSFGADIGALVKNLELVLSSEALKGRERDIEYVDLRFGNRVYYKFKGGKEISL